MGFFHRIFSLLVDFIFPRPETLEFLEKLTKEELLAKVPTTKASNTSPSAEIRSVFNYRQPIIRQMIWELKYKGNKKIARLFGQVLYDEISRIVSLKTDLFPHPLVLPMPNSLLRRKERGFNQCELLTNELTKLNTQDLFSVQNNILLKWKDTPRQTTNNRALRLQNVKGCFSVIDSSILQNHCIIIIDDVTTTESTLREAIATLYASGARKVIGLTIAH